MLEQTKMNMPDKKQFKTFYIIAGIAVLVLIWLSYTIFWPVNFEQKTLVMIEQGAGLGEIAGDLKQARVIKSSFVFQAFVVLQGRHNDLIAGAYEIQKANMPGVLDKLVKGEVATVNLVFTEGRNLNDLADWLEQEQMFSKDQVFAFTGIPAIDLREQENTLDWEKLKQSFPFLQGKPDYVSLEGYLFPDTYQIKKSEIIEQVISKMLLNFDEKTKAIRQEAEKQGRDFFEILTMASLLEKEVKTYEEKQMVAGILRKRLSNGWKLQIDAALTYLTEKPSLSLTNDDLALDSLYNTYKYYGLPLGPICSPGLESIKAALYSKSSPYWFYLTTKDGKAIFSADLAEHNRNKNKYLR